ncbi:MAG: N-acetylmuramoyl-L-alanine amidase [Duncaniella sp.]|nr:N-acetylmuramoyl-L-alanine amidase [Duncaniella sp.]
MSATIRHILLRFILICAAFAATAPQAEAKDFVVVIDPGHGGKDAGALGAKTNEKSINLKVANKLAALIEKDMEDARAVMTRSTDKFVTLQGRADIANRAGADIFVSIHANSVDFKNKNRASIHGAAVYTLGLRKSETNLAVAMRENAVIKLEQDYSTTYHGFDPSSAESYIMFEMMQHNNLDQSINLAQAIQKQLVSTAKRKNNGVKQAPFWVLVSTGMPAVLVELDFISNPAAENYMSSDEGSSALARAIFNGIKNYRASAALIDEEKPARKNAVKDAANTAAEPTETAAADATQDSSTKQDVVYKIQFLSSPTKLKTSDQRLKGLGKTEHYRDGKLYKYTTGSFSSMREAQKELSKVRKKYPDAFVIKTRDGKRIK